MRITRHTDNTGTERQSDDLVRVVFEVEPDEVGYPPARSETLWAVEIGDNTYRLANAPLFADGLSVDDVVEADDHKGALMFSRVVGRGGHSTLRIFIEGRKDLRRQVLEELTSLGCNLEESDDYNLVAVDVPAEVSLKSVSEVLEPHRQKGSLDYWAGSISPSHDAEGLPI